MKKHQSTLQDPSLRAMGWAAAASVFLTVLKLVGYFSTGSVLALSAAYDSLMDSVASTVNQVIYRRARKSADREHPFGHGGLEVLASLVQGFVLLLLALSLIRESYASWHHPAIDAEAMASIPMACAILLFSGVSGMLIHARLNRVARRSERSLVLEADLAHYGADMGVNFLSALGLAVVYWSEQPGWDSLFGLASGLLLAWTSVPILRKVVAHITHHEAPQQLQQQLVDLAAACDPQIRGIHKLRSREFGPHIFVDFHLSLPSKITLLEAHHIADRVETQICAQLPHVDVLIHLDPEAHPEEQDWEPTYTPPQFHGNDTPSSPSTTAAGTRNGSGS